MKIQVTKNASDFVYITTESGKVYRIKENEEGNLEIMTPATQRTIAVKPVCSNVIEVC